MGLKIFLVLSFMMITLLLSVTVLNHFDDRNSNKKMQIQISRMAHNDSLRIRSETTRIKRERVFQDSLLRVVNRQMRIIKEIENGAILHSENRRNR